MENVHTYPKFTPEMKATHKILIPNMAPIHFEMMRAAMEDEGYHVEVLGSGGHAVAQEGLKYVHNDTCYPALLVIGQFINALKSGKRPCLSRRREAGAGRPTTSTFCVRRW